MWLRTSRRRGFRASSTPPSGRRVVSLSPHVAIDRSFSFDPGDEGLLTMAPQMRAVAAGSTLRPIRRRRPATSKTASFTRSPFAGRSFTAWSDAFRSGGRSSNAKTVGAHPMLILSGCTCRRCLKSPATAATRARSCVSLWPTAYRSNFSSAGLVRTLPPCSRPAPPLSDRTTLRPRRKRGRARSGVPHGAGYPAAAARSGLLPVSGGRRSA
jgi:hypothetical protein